MRIESSKQLEARNLVSVANLVLGRHEATSALAM